MLHSSSRRATTNNNAVHDSAQRYTAVVVGGRYLHTKIGAHRRRSQLPEEEETRPELVAWSVWMVWGSAFSDSTSVAWSLLLCETVLRNVSTDCVCGQ